MTLSEYFALPNTPAEKSPAGKLIVAILEDSPSMTFEDARSAAHECLYLAAGSKKYHVLSPKRLEARREKARTYFAARKAVA